MQAAIRGTMAMRIQKLRRCKTERIGTVKLHTDVVLVVLNATM